MSASHTSHRKRHSLAKVRAACDRCHSKKLKCERTVIGCTRCDQASLPCVFSPRRPYDISNRARQSSQRPHLRISQSNAAESSLAPSDTTQGLDLLEDWTRDGFDFFLNLPAPTQHAALPFQTTGIETLWSRDHAFRERSASITSSSTSLLGSSSLAGSASVLAGGVDNTDPVAVEAPNNIVATENSHGVAHTSRIADIVPPIFQKIELDNLRLPPSNSHCPSPRDISGSYPDLYAHTFNTSRALMQALPLFGESRRSTQEEWTIQIDDADVVLILSCFLKLLTRYDRIFTLWLDILNPSSLASTNLRSSILRLLPPVSIGMFITPTCDVAQIRLVLGVSATILQELIEGLKTIATSIVGRDRMANADVLPHVSETTIELVMGKMREVRRKKEAVMKRIKDTELQERLEVILSNAVG